MKVSFSPTPWTGVFTNIPFFLQFSRLHRTVASPGILCIPSNLPCAAGTHPVAVFFPHNTTLGESSVYHRFFKRDLLG
jgi:hypothetical protein